MYIYRYHELIFTLNLDLCIPFNLFLLFVSSVERLLNVCESLERIGNLDRWEIGNLAQVLCRLETQYEWKTCPVFYNSKIESTITMDHGIV